MLSVNSFVLVDVGSVTFSRLYLPKATEGYRRLPKAAEGHRRLPKADVSDVESCVRSFRAVIQGGPAKVRPTHIIPGKIGKIP